jgi:hypothetical protein
MKIHEALLIIIEEAEKSDPMSAVRYAAAYAERGRKMRPGTEEWRTQMLYIKSNLVYYRGPHAKEIKEAVNAEIAK